MHINKVFESGDLCLIGCIFGNGCGQTTQIIKANKLKGIKEDFSQKLGVQIHRK